MTKIIAFKFHYLFVLTIIFSFFSASVYAKKNKILFINDNNSKQVFDYAGKLQWNNKENRWDKVVVIYNNAPKPFKSHPVYKYVKKLKIPSVAEKHQYDLSYKAFYKAGNCSAKTPLRQGKPWYINFDTDAVGDYTKAKLRQDWNCPKWSMGNNLIDVVNGPQAYQGNALRLNYPGGAFSCKKHKTCANWRSQLGGNFNQVTYSYKLKLGRGFEFVKGGKLPGVGGGKGNTGGKKPNGSDGWSVRAMWNRQGKLIQYVYHPDQPRRFGEAFEWNMSPLVRGKWYTLKTTVRINTPGQKNGQIQSWLNGRLVLDKRDIRFRDTAKLQIDQFMFVSFYGGGNKSWAPKNNQVAYFDEFMITAK